MPDCRPCLEKRLIAKPALYVVNGVPLCEECKQNPEKRNEKLKKEEVKMEKELCFCGREKGHRGRHKGSGVKQMTVRVKKDSSRDSSRDYSISDIIAQLEQRRDKLSAAIESLRDAEK
jgi:hypothetical protein